MSDQDLKFITNLFASLDYSIMCSLSKFISSIIENGHKKIQDFYSPIDPMNDTGYFINPQIDKKLGILSKVNAPITTYKFYIPLLKKGEIELWKVLSCAIKDTMKRVEYQVLNAMRKNGTTISNLCDDDAGVINRNYPYQIEGDDVNFSEFIKFVIYKKEFFKKKIGDKVYLQLLRKHYEKGMFDDFNYKVYSEQVDPERWGINFNSYELYHEYLMYHVAEDYIDPGHLSIYSSNGDLIFYLKDGKGDDRLTMHFLLQLPSFVVNYEQLIKIDQDRIKKQQAKKKQHQQTMQHLQSAGFNFG